MELVAEKLLPPKGVYATAVEIGGKYYTGVTNVGCKPTVNHSNKVNVETHILDFSGDLYGYELKVSFYSFIRPEQRFSSVEMLKEQMERLQNYVDIVIICCYTRFVMRFHET